MFTRAAVAAVTIALAGTNVASAQSFNTLSQQAIDFQMNGEVSRPTVTLPAGAYASIVAPKRINRPAVLVPQTRDFQDEPGR